MAERARDLMLAVEQRLQELERVTRDTATAQWAQVCKAEGWPVALVAYHVARGFDRVASFIEAAASGEGRTATTGTRRTRSTRGSRASTRYRPATRC